MRKFFILLAASMLCFVCGSKAENTAKQTSVKLVAERVLIGDLYYNLYDNGTAEVTYELANFPFNTDHLKGAITIPSSVQVESTTYVVTGIEVLALWNCRSLSSITIPNSVTSIGEKAFYNCKRLTSITIPRSAEIGKEAFVGCSPNLQITRTKNK